ncbi:hypothetical protein CMV_006525 [Castanea mollissima]|uniref:Secreted protein n=1 Tax=Castanea mollissima TaxID=60419 RepID=A0A8J4RVF9_9ROSI|nr:hypothetical protein CMV_006525 [Castanea mollissima]
MFSHLSLSILCSLSGSWLCSGLVDQSGSPWIGVLACGLVTKWCYKATSSNSQADPSPKPPIHTSDPRLRSTPPTRLAFRKY